MVECKRQASLVAAFAAAPKNCLAAGWTDASMRIVEGTNNQRDGSLVNIGLWAGLTLIHFSAQPQPFLVTEATASVHFSAQPETFLPMRLVNIAHNKC